MIKAHLNRQIGHYARLKDSAAACAADCRESAHMGIPNWEKEAQWLAANAQCKMGWWQARYDELRKALRAVRRIIN